MPLEMRKAVARAIETAIAERFAGKSERVIAKALGVSQPALNKLRHLDGALGVNALLCLRASLKISIDELLGLPPLVESLDDRIRRVLLEHEQQKPAAKGTSNAPPAPPRPARPRRGVHHE